MLSDCLMLVTETLRNPFVLLIDEEEQVSRSTCRVPALPNSPVNHLAEKKRITYLRSEHKETSLVLLSLLSARSLFTLLHIEFLHEAYDQFEFALSLVQQL